MTVKVIHKPTGERKVAVYAANSGGNMRYNVDGKFYTDKKFNSLFGIVKDETENLLMWKSQIRQLFEEILLNPTCAILYRPFQITLSILGDAANRAAELQDDELIGHFCRLGLYTFSDPTEKDYDEERTDFYISKTK